jgi:hypothetical protein
MNVYSARPEARMNPLRRWWPDLLIVVGIAWLSFACAAFAGDGSVEGQLDQGGGDVAGDFSFGYTERERLNVAVAAAVTTIGVLGKVNRRRDQTAPVAPAPAAAPPASPEISTGSGEND